MAGDWIKMRVGLVTNPRVLRIAECLVENADFLKWSGLSFGINGYPPPTAAEIRAERHAALRVTRYVTVTALLRWWGYANEHIKDEEIIGIFPEDVDEITGVPGFAEAIEACGWVQFNPDGGAVLPNFNEHNTSSDARSSGAERQRRYREARKEAAKSDVTRDVTSDAQRREEKSREDQELSVTSLRSVTDGDRREIAPTADGGGSEEEITDSGRKSGARHVPACPGQKLADLFVDILPELPSPAVWNSKRQRTVSCRWREMAAYHGWASEAEGIDWFRRLFVKIRDAPFLMGRVPPRDRNRPPFRMDFDWLFGPENFTKVIEGKYHEAREARH